MTTKVLKPSLLRPFTQPRTSILQTPRNRTLFSSAPSELSASRSMSYPAKKIYDIIADIESYPKFIPGCTSAKITSYSKEDEHFKQKWPQEATLGIGYGDSINEKFTSRVYCVPPVSEQGRAGMGYVEAVSGEAEHQMDEGFVEHHTESSSSASQKDSPMEFLRTRWTVKAYPFKPAPPSGIGYAAKDGEKKKEEESQPAHEVCDVTLSIQYKFRNPVYDMMSKAVAPKMADKMVEAFEKRVRKLLD